MRAVAVFTSLLSVAAGLPSLVKRGPELITRDTRILDYTIETWPTVETLYNN